MTALKALWSRAKGPILWMAIGGVVIGGWQVGRHLYIDHLNLHTMVQWVANADKELAAIRQANTPKAPPAPVEAAK